MLDYLRWILLLSGVTSLLWQSPTCRFSANFAVILFQETNHVPIFKASLALPSNFPIKKKSVHVCLLFTFRSSFARKIFSIKVACFWSAHPLTTSVLDWLRNGGGIGPKARPSLWLCQFGMSGAAWHFKKIPFKFQWFLLGAGDFGLWTMFQVWIILKLDHLLETLFITCVW